MLTGNSRHFRMRHIRLVDACAVACNGKTISCAAGVPILVFLFESNKVRFLKCSAVSGFVSLMIICCLTDKTWRSEEEILAVRLGYQPKYNYYMKVNSSNKHINLFQVSHHLTHWGLVTPYDVIVIRKHLTREWCDGSKPLPEPVFTYCALEHISVKFYLIMKNVVC